MKPHFKQGDDGLCGFYAVLNAVRWIEHKLGDDEPTEEQQREFFDEAVECLARVRGVTVRIFKGNAVEGGIDKWQIKELCDLIVERWDLPIKVELSNSDRRSLSQLMQKMRSNRSHFAAIVGERGGGHWVAIGDDPNQQYYTLIDNAEPDRKMIKRGSGPALAAKEAIVMYADVR